MVVVVVVVMVVMNRPQHPGHAVPEVTMLGVPLPAMVVMMVVVMMRCVLRLEEAGGRCGRLRVGELQALHRVRDGLQQVGV
jgi:hypothetical protein